MIYSRYYEPDPTDEEPDLCMDCGESTSGTSLCGPCADARFNDPISDDLPEEE